MLSIFSLCCFNGFNSPFLDAAAAFLGKADAVQACSSGPGYKQQPAQWEPAVTNVTERTFSSPGPLWISSIASLNKWQKKNALFRVLHIPRLGSNSYLTHGGSGLEIGDKKQPASRRWFVFYLFFFFFANIQAGVEWFLSRSLLFNSVLLIIP